MSLGYGFLPLGFCYAIQDSFRVSSVGAALRKPSYCVHNRDERSVYVRVKLNACDRSSKNSHDDEQRLRKSHFNAVAAISFSRLGQCYDGICRIW